MSPRHVLVLLCCVSGIALVMACGGTSSVGRASDGPQHLATVTAVGEDGIHLGAGCFEQLEADAEPRGDQIVVTRLDGRGVIAGDCSIQARIEFAPGPDVVHPEAEARFTMIDGDYRRVDYCGLDTPRCVPFSTEVVTADCSDASLRFATLGAAGGVYPMEVLRCEEPWAMVALDLCGGVHGDDGQHCDEGVVTSLLVIDDGDRWVGTGFEQALFCPDPADRFGAPGLPDWACDV